MPGCGCASAVVGWRGAAECGPVRRRGFGFAGAARGLGLAVDGLGVVGGDVAGMAAGRGVRGLGRCARGELAGAGCGSCVGRGGLGLCAGGRGLQPRVRLDWRRAAAGAGVDAWGAARGGVDERAGLGAAVLGAGVRGLARGDARAAGQRNAAAEFQHVAAEAVHVARARHGGAGGGSDCGRIWCVAGRGVGSAGGGASRSG